MTFHSLGTWVSTSSHTHEFYIKVPLAPNLSILADFQYLQLYTRLLILPLMGHQPCFNQCKSNPKLPVPRQTYVSLRVYLGVFPSNRCISYCVPKHPPYPIPHNFPVPGLKVKICVIYAAEEGERNSLPLSLCSGICLDEKLYQRMCHWVISSLCKPGTACHP